MMFSDMDVPDNILQPRPRLFVYPDPLPTAHIKLIRLQNQALTLDVPLAPHEVKNVRVLWIGVCGNEYALGLAVDDYEVCG